MQNECALTQLNMNCRAVESKNSGVASYAFDSSLTCGSDHILYSQVFNITMTTV